MRNYLDVRFRDFSGQSFATMRRIAHAAIDELIKGNVTDARRGIQRLGSEAEGALFAKLRELGIDVGSDTL